MDSPSLSLCVSLSLSQDPSLSFWTAVLQPAACVATAACRLLLQIGRLMQQQLYFLVLLLRPYCQPPGGAHWAAATNQAASCVCGRNTPSTLGLLHGKHTSMVLAHR